MCSWTWSENTAHAQSLLMQTLHVLMPKSHPQIPWNPFKMWRFKQIYQSQIPRILPDFGWEGLGDLLKKQRFTNWGGPKTFRGGGGRLLIRTWHYNNSVYFSSWICKLPPIWWQSTNYTVIWFVVWQLYVKPWIDTLGSLGIQTSSNMTIPTVALNKPKQSLDCTGPRSCAGGASRPREASQEVLTTQSVPISVVASRQQDLGSWLRRVMGFYNSHPRPTVSFAFHACVTARRKGSKIWERNFGCGPRKRKKKKQNTQVFLLMLPQNKPNDSVAIS